MGAAYRKNKKSNILWLIPLIIAVAIVPIIVRMVPTDLSTLEQIMLGKAETNDFFSKGKSMLLMFSGALAFIFFISKYLMSNNYKDIIVTKLYIFTGIYSLFAIISTIAAKYQDFFQQNYSKYTFEGVSIPNSIALWGFWDRYEGLFVLLTYMILLIYAINIIEKEFQLKAVITSAIIGACIIGSIGIFQFFDMDFFRTDFGKVLMVPTKYKQIREAVVFNFGKGTIYTTLYNTNYVGTYMAMFLPITFGLFMHLKGRNKYIMGVVTTLIFVNLIGSNSSAGMLATLVGLVFFVFLFRKQIVSNWKGCIILLLAFSLSFVGMDFYADHKITRELGLNIWSSSEHVDSNEIIPVNQNENLVDIVLEDEDIEFIGENVTLRLGQNNGPNFVITNDKNIVLPYFSVTKNYFEMHFVRKSLTLVYDVETSQFKFFDTNFEAIPVVQTDTVITLDDENYQDVSVEFSPNYDAIYINYLDHQIVFDFSTDGDLSIYHNEYELFEIEQFSVEGLTMENPIEMTSTGESIKILDEEYYHYFLTFNQESDYLRTYIGNKSIGVMYNDGNASIVSNGGYVIDEIVEAETDAFFNERQAFASNRGYIWSRSIPIIKDTIFVGTGPDTYALVFPQNDVVAKANNFLSSQILVDKPHNMYLQIGINTGVVSLIALLILFAIYGVWTLKLYWKKNIATYSDYVAVGIFVAVIGYLVSGIANDSIVSVAPVFWVLLGVGLSLNFKTEKENKKAESIRKKQEAKKLKNA